jgi:hypothetical protein
MNLKSNIERRLAVLEGKPERDDLILTSHQWFNEDGTPAGEKVERWVPRSRIQPLEKIFEMFEERDQHEGQRQDEVRL